MKLRRLVKARGCGVFADYSWPATLPPYEDRVLIYGWNGAGKTTLTSIIRELETRRSSFEGHEWVFDTDGVQIRSHQVSPDAPAFPVRVFNSDFVAESVFTSTGELPPVLYLGKGTIAKQKRLDECSVLLREAEDSISQLVAARDEAERQLDIFRTNQAKLTKEALRSSGTNPYNNYDKGAYRTRVESLRAQARLPNVLTEPELEALRAAMEAPSMAVVPLVRQGPAFSAELGRQVKQVLSESVTSALLERLTDDPAVGRWVEAGLQLHEERESTVCLFCGDNLRPETLADLTRHFDSAFKARVAEIEGLLSKVQSARLDAGTIALPVSAQLSPLLHREYEVAASAFERSRVEFVAHLRAIEAVLLTKRDAPFRVFDEADGTLAPSSLSVDLINEFIQRHNDLQNGSSARVAKARAGIGDDLILQGLPKLTELEAKVSQLTEGQRSVRQSWDSLQAEASELEREIVEHLTPADQLTSELAMFLGREDIAFQPSGAGYALMRLGKPAKGLSEGEKSAIALLYFLKTLRDRAFDRAEGVVVIDDPVSSLDSNALFCALGCLQAETEDIGQLIFLTHNFAFFRELRKWLSPKTHKASPPCSLLFITCQGPCETRHAILEPLDRLLRDYDSEYQYLFKLVWEASQATDSTNLERLFHYPNVARRLLEAFFAFRMPDVSQGGLRGRLKQTKLDAAKRERMLRFLDFQSHDDGVDIPEDDLSSLAEAPVVLREVLELMKEEDSGHFERMRRLVTATQGDE